MIRCPSSRLKNNLNFVDKKLSDSLIRCTRILPIHSVTEKKKIEHLKINIVQFHSVEWGSAYTQFADTIDNSNAFIVHRSKHPMPTTIEQFTSPGQ